VCNRYVSPDAAAIERHWQLRSGGLPWPRREVFPRSQGAFIRAMRKTGEAELAVGQWALIPWFAKTPKLSYSTNNCRWETVASAASFKQAWARGQRCIIPAELFFEPNWESGKNEWWAFRRADGTPWGLAGLWDIWLDKASGELVESYTMLTMNADAHPLMKRMHKPDPSLGPDQQDKRSVVVIEADESEVWLHGAAQEAAALVRLAPVTLFQAGPQVV